MATGPLQLLLLLSLLTATASARPCKTIFYFSSTTTYYPFHSHPGNPNFTNSVQSQDLRHLTLIFTTTPRFREIHSSLNFNPYPASDDDLQASTSSDFPLKYLSSVPRSVRDRTKDIMSVVGALLFGVGCGALTAAIMYFVWALVSPQSFDFDDLSSSSDDDDDDDTTAANKKFAYVAIPVNQKVVNDDDLKKPAQQAKGVV